MTSSTHGKSLVRLGLCLLLASNMLLWSTAWSATASPERQFEQLGDRSPPFLVRTDENSTGDIPLAICDTHPIIVPALRALVTGCTDTGVTHRIRIASFPVMPQAPPATT